MAEAIASISAVLPATSVGDRVFASGNQPSPTPQASSADDTLGQALEVFRSHFAEQQPELTFRLDTDKGDLVVSVIDSRDNTVLRQIPSAEARRIAHQLEKLGSSGTLLRQSA